MASYNRVILVGNLTRDPELRYIPSGTAVTDIGLAVSDKRKNANGEWVEEVNFINVTLWARTAEVASEYLSKGSSVLIEGRLKFDQWEKDGQKMSKLKVVADRMQMLGGRSGGGDGGGGGGGNRSAAPDNQYSEAAPAQDDFGPPPQQSGGGGGGGGDGGGGGGGGGDDIPF